MTWARNRAVALIGGGVALVAVLALGVAIGHRSAHRGLLFDGPFVARSFVTGPYAGPGMLARRLGTMPAPEKPGMPPFPDGGPVPFSGAAPLGGPYASTISPFGAVSPFGLVHGQVTEPAPGGGYQTTDVQRGIVTKLSATTITVRSADGFSADYRATRSQLDGVAKGDTVQLRATVAGRHATIETLTDLTR